MKTITLLPLIGLFFSLSAASQPIKRINCNALLAEVANVLELMRKYEAAVMILPKLKDTTTLIGFLYKDRPFPQPIAASPEEGWADYKNAISSIKKNKDTFRLCIDSELQKKSLSKYFNETVPYHFEDPVQSLRMKNTISRYDFFRVFKHYIFELNADTLPSFKEVTLFLDKEHSIICDPVLERLFEIVKLKNEHSSIVAVRTDASWNKEIMQ
jgi:hypothetical protein